MIGVTSRNNLLRTLLPFQVILFYIYRVYKLFLVLHLLFFTTSIETYSVFRVTDLSVSNNTQYQLLNRPKWTIFTTAFSPFVKFPLLHSDTCVLHIQSLPKKNPPINCLKQDSQSRVLHQELRSWGFCVSVSLANTIRSLVSYPFIGSEGSFTPEGRITIYPEQLTALSKN